MCEFYRNVSGGLLIIYHQAGSVVLRNNFIEGGPGVEKPAEKLSLAWATSHLVRAPNFRSGGHEFESSVRQELCALTKSGKTLVVRSF
jgi:hypothetical protein